MYKANLDEQSDVLSSLQMKMRRDFGGLTEYHIFVDRLKKICAMRSTGRRWEVRKCT